MLRVNNRTRRELQGRTYWLTWILECMAAEVLPLACSPLPSADARLQYSSILLPTCVQAPTLLARAAGMPEHALNSGLSGHQYRAANKAISGLKVSTLSRTTACKAVPSLRQLEPAMVTAVQPHACQCGDANFHNSGGRTGWTLWDHVRTLPMASYRVQSAATHLICYSPHLPPVRWAPRTFRAASGCTR